MKTEVRSMKDFHLVTESLRSSVNMIVPCYSHLLAITYLFCVSPSGKNLCVRNKKRRYIISKNFKRVLMFHLCLLKCMIKLFFLSSFLFFLASLITENYKLAVNILTFKTTAFIVFGFDLPGLLMYKIFRG